MPTDEDLLERWRRGDTQAGTLLFDRHYDSLVRFFGNKAADRDAADLVQRTFLALVESRDRFRGEASFRTFLFATARNQLFKYYRNRSRAPQLDFAVTAVRDLAPSPSSLVARRREHQVLLQALRQIPLDYQIVLELYFWESMTSAAIAAVIDVPESTARTRLRRAKQLLRGAIEAVAESPAELESTLGGLDRWATELRTSSEES